MSDWKKNILSALIGEYHIQSADDLQDVLKYLPEGIIQEMLKSEMTEHLWFDVYKCSETINYWNGKKIKLSKVNKGSL